MYNKKCLSVPSIKVNVIEVKMKKYIVFVESFSSFRVFQEYFRTAKPNQRPKFLTGHVGELVDGLLPGVTSLPTKKSVLNIFYNFILSIQSHISNVCRTT